MAEANLWQRQIMKKMLLVLWVSFGAYAADPAAGHGMLLFGKEATYVSHLPMFHSPHDYQVILRVNLDANAQRDLKRAKDAARTEKVWTIDPESFVLPARINDPRPFRADIYQGHFERGGKRVIRQANVAIEQVIHFRKFVAGETADKALFFTFGTPGDMYSAHIIRGAPDFDRITEVQPLSDGTLQAGAVIYEETKDLEQ